MGRRRATWTSNEYFAHKKNVGEEAKLKDKVTCIERSYGLVKDSTMFKVCEAKNSLKELRKSTGHSIDALPPTPFQRKASVVSLPLGQLFPSNPMEDVPPEYQYLEKDEDFRPNVVFVDIYESQKATKEAQDYQWYDGQQKGYFINDRQLINEQGNASTNNQEIDLNNNSNNQILSNKLDRTHHSVEFDMDRLRPPIGNMQFEMTQRATKTNQGNGIMKDKHGSEIKLPPIRNNVSQMETNIPEINVHSSSSSVVSLPHINNNKVMQLSNNGDSTTSCDIPRYDLTGENTISGQSPSISSPKLLINREETDFNRESSRIESLYSSDYYDELDLQGEFANSKSNTSLTPAASRRGSQNLGAKSGILKGYISPVYRQDTIIPSGFPSNRPAKGNNGKDKSVQKRKTVPSKKKEKDSNLRDIRARCRTCQERFRQNAEYQRLKKEKEQQELIQFNEVFPMGNKLLPKAKPFTFTNDDLESLQSDEVLDFDDVINKTARQTVKPTGTCKKGYSRKRMELLAQPRGERKRIFSKSLIRKQADCLIESHSQPELTEKEKERLRVLECKIRVFLAMMQDSLVPSKMVDIPQREDIMKVDISHH